jgi:hypothetical protein
MKRHGSKDSARLALVYADRAIRRGALAGLAGMLLFGSTVLWAQQAGPGNRAAAAAAPPSARDEAPYDLSGYWVSLITQNWRLRMVVKGPGDYIGVPMNPEAKKIADAWTPAAAEAAAKACAAYGGGIIMYLPERIHISWQDANELKVDTDAGMQTRVLHFVPAGAPAEAPLQSPSDTQASLQGYSVARWVLPAAALRGRPGGASGPHSQYGSIQVTTDHMLPGLLTKNGIPYDGQAKKTEWWDLRKVSTDEQWLTISTTLVDPHYLTRPYIYDPIFQREADGAKWDPSPCALTP